MEMERWQKFSFAEQMGHIGSEFLRAKSRTENNDFENGKKSLEIVIDFLDLTISDSKNNYRLFEILRLKEVICDLYVNPEPSRRVNPEPSRRVNPEHVRRVDSKKYRVSYDYLKKYFLFFSLIKI